MIPFAFTLIPFIAFGYVLIVAAWSGNVFGNPEPIVKQLQQVTAPNILNRLFWPVLLAITLLLAFQYRSRLKWTGIRSAPVISLAAYLIFAGLSVTWAYNPEQSLLRYMQTLIVVLIIIVPYSLQTPKIDTVNYLYICYAISIALNAVVVLGEVPTLTASGTLFGYHGYFSIKNYLGECASIAILLALFSLRTPGWRRFAAIAVIGTSAWLISASNSKGSLAFLVFSPVLAALVLVVSRSAKTSLGVILAFFPLAYFLASLVFSDLFSRISFFIYGDSTLTGRTFIWDFIQYETSKNPWFGWGFHSFWLLGPNAPSVVEAPQWVKNLTGSHNGYLDIRLETGYVGLTIFIGFIIATLHAIERVRRQDAFRAWFLLSLALYVIITNLLETTFLFNDPTWLLFLFIVAETTRYPAHERRRVVVHAKRNQVDQKRAGTGSRFSPRAPTIPLRNR